MFNISRSIDIILGPIVGGVGTLFGPILGSFVIEIIGEGLRSLLESFGIDVPGIKQVVFGFILLLVVLVMPDGVWPWLARKLGLTEQQK